MPLFGPYNRLELYQLFQKLEFVRLIDKYGLRGAAADAAQTGAEGAVHPPAGGNARRCGQPAPFTLRGTAVWAVAWAEGVCALTPMEAQMGQLSLAGKQLIFHDSKTAMHRLDELGMTGGGVRF